MRFLVSPVELIGDAQGPRRRACAWCATRSWRRPTGALSARATGEFEDLDVGLVFRSVGYRGVALPGVPFHERWGVILNEKGRVLDPDDQAGPVTGCTPPAGSSAAQAASSAPTSPTRWRPSPSMLEDVAQRRALAPGAAGRRRLRPALVQARQPLFVTYADWRRLDALEVEQRPGVRPAAPEVHDGR